MHKTSAEGQPPKGLLQNCEDDRSSSISLAAPPQYHDAVPTRHSKFWFNDGNVIIHVGGYLFRIHTSNLVLRSPFFADLFAREHGGTEKVDGCNVYALQGRACDLTALLDAVYCDLLFPEKEPSFFTLACMLRAAHRWNIPAFKRWALAMLEKRWPPTLDQVHNQDDFTVFATKIIILFRECNETSLLKRAFYRLLNVEKFGIGTGEKAAESELLDSQSDKPQYYYHDTPRWTTSDSELSIDDVALMIGLHERVVRLWTTFVVKPQPSNFLDKEKCDKSKKRCNITISHSEWSAQVLVPFLNRGCFDPLGCLQDMKDGAIWKCSYGLGKEEVLCKGCNAGCAEWLEGERVRIWGALDDVFEANE